MARPVARMAAGLTAAICVLLWVAGASAEERPPLVAVFTKNTTNPAYDGFRIGADKAAAAAGARTRHYVPVKPDNVEEQTLLIDQALADKPDMVVFIPVDDVAMVGPLRKITEARIPVVTAVSRIKGDVITFVGSDDVDVGRKEARYLFDKMGGSGKIVILEGIPSSPTSRDRKAGYQQALAEFSGIKVLESRVANYQRSDARQAIGELMKTYPEIDAVLAANDAMALGAYDALRESAQLPLIAGINGVAEAVAKIDEGAILVSVDFSAFNMACVAMDAVLRSRNGATVPSEIILPAEIIDRNNHKKWLTPVKDRPCLPLDAALK